MSARRCPALAAVLLLVAAAGCVDQPAPFDEGLPLQAARVPGPDIMAVQNRYTPDLMSRPGIVGTGIRLAESGEQSIVVYAVTPAQAAAARIPERLEGFGVHVAVTGLIMATDYDDPTTRQRPAPNGFSVGHYAITAGTIGARVKKAGGGVYILSNNHVLANTNDGVTGDAIYQPGPYDGGTAADKIGELADFEPINMSITATNTMDAAIALVDAADLLGATPTYAYGAPGSTPVNATLNLPVKKFGRTTGLTHGTVAEVNLTVEVCYDAWAGFCFESAYFKGQLGITPGTFSGGGDSGSLIVTDNAGNSPVGLLFAGSSTRTIANPIGPVLARFGVTIDPGTSEPPPPDYQPPVAAFTATCIKGACSFTDQSYDQDEGGRVTAWSWNFGNRKTSTAQNPTTNYSKAGTYNVALTVWDAAGKSGTTSDAITCTKTGKTLSCGL